MASTAGGHSRNTYQLPFHALRLNAENDNRLLDHADVIYAPSCAVAGQLLQTPARPGTTVVTAVDLHHARDEATVVGALADNPRLLIGHAATPAAVLESLQGAARLHVCSHGHYDSKDFLASRLDLAPSSRQTGRLTVARILADADLRGMDMVVLGACLSGAGHTTPSSLDIAGGIDSAFLAAGVRNVVCALWEIDDLAALLSTPSCTWR